MKIKVGIVGCGNVANNKHLPGLSKIDDVEIMAFHDISIEKAQSAGDQFGSENFKVYETAQDLFEDPAIDVVHICTVNNSHAPLSIAAMEAGKNVMVEKPMAMNGKEAREMAFWIESLRKGIEPPVTAYQALVITDILDALYESDQQGGAVNL